MVVLLAACAVEPVDESVVESEAGCGGGGCDENSPWIAGAPFFELHRTRPNDHPLHLRVLGIWSAAGQPYVLDVPPNSSPGSGARIVGLDSQRRVALDTAAMTNAVI